MNQELVIRIMPSMYGDVSASSLQWVVRGGEEDFASTIHYGSFADLKIWSEQVRTEHPDQESEQAVVLVPGTMASLQCLSVSPAQKKHMKKALPYLIEEALIGSIEEEHIVGQAQSSGEGDVLAGYIAIATMNRLLEQVIEAGINPVSVVPENCLWHSDTNTVTLLFECGMVTFWSNTMVAQTIDQVALPLVLNQCFDSEQTFADDDDTVDITDGESHQASAIRVKVLYEQCEGEPQWSEYDELAGRDITIETLGTERGSVLVALIEMLEERRKARALIEFRSGAFKCPKKAGKRWRQWRPVAWVAGSWLVLECLFYSGQGFWYQYQAANYYERNYALYKEINPADRSVVDVRSRFNSLLKRSATSHTGNDFLQVLKTISKVSSQTAAEGIEPKSLDFNKSENGLTLNVIASSFDAINRYLEALGQASLQATMKTANQEGDRVVAQLSIKSS
ncbi:MAG: hypothetical protein KAG53_01205 [Endozoicomonadaceae bacterium]|nr:hypothetical protein [Endozoicomonadaceae bacterium]